MATSHTSFKKAIGMEHSVPAKDTALGELHTLPLVGLPMQNEAGLLSTLSDSYAKAVSGTDCELRSRVSVGLTWFRIVRMGFWVLF